jgi:hypothetical protein
MDCPKCNRIDNVQKVTAIVQGGTHQINGQVPVSHTYQDSEGWHTNTSYESYNATQRTTLAHKLMPPPKPQKRINRFVGFLLMAGMFFGIMGVCSFTAIVSSESEVSRKSSGNMSSSLGVGLLPVSIIAFYGLVRIYLRTEKPLKEKLAVDLAKWEYSLRKWQELYYCSRDDCLFFPEERKAYNISNMYDAINWHP